MGFFFQCIADKCLLNHTCTLLKISVTCHIWLVNWQKRKNIIAPYKTIKSLKLTYFYISSKHYKTGQKIKDNEDRVQNILTKVKIDPRSWCPYLWGVTKVYNLKHDYAKLSSWPISPPVWIQNSFMLSVYRVNSRCSFMQMPLAAGREVRQLYWQAIILSGPSGWLFSSICKCHIHIVFNVIQILAVSSYKRYCTRLKSTFAFSRLPQGCSSKCPSFSRPANTLLSLARCCMALGFSS